MTSATRAPAAFLLALVAVGCAGSGRIEPPLVVHDGVQLIAALQPGNAGRRIVVARGEYRVDRPLQVPEGATLEGAGVMRTAAGGIPDGFEPGTETTLRVVAGFQGQVLTLGNGSVVRGLRLIDLENPASQPALRRGNVVYIASRAPGDVISASVVECEIVTPHVAGFSEVGPHGHGLVVLTLNPNLGAPPSAHEGARVELAVRRSIVRTRAGAAVFANNFAPASEIRLALEGNRFDGYLIAAGGTTRPEQVHDSRTVVESSGNLYRRTGFDRFGWHLLGASTSPHVQEGPGQGGARNSLRMTSANDRVEGFRVGIQAVAARRLGLDSDLLNDNRLDLDLQGTHILTEGEGAADLVLRSTLSEIEQAKELADFAAGDRNVMQVLMSGVRGSGVRNNVYAVVTGPRRPQDYGTGNRLTFRGGREAFLRSNQQLDPVPPARLFAEDAGRASATDE